MGVSCWGKGSISNDVGIIFNTRDVWDVGVEEGKACSKVVWVLFLIPVMFSGIAMKKIEPFNSMGIIFNTRVAEGGE